MAGNTSNRELDESLSLVIDTSVVVGVRDKNWTHSLPQVCRSLAHLPHTWGPRALFVHSFLSLLSFGCCACAAAEEEDTKTFNGDRSLALAVCPPAPLSLSIGTFGGERKRKVCSLLIFLLAVRDPPPHSAECTQAVRG